MADRAIRIDAAWFHTVVIDGMKGHRTILTLQAVPCELNRVDLRDKARFTPPQDRIGWASKGYSTKFAQNGASGASERTERRQWCVTQHGLHLVRRLSCLRGDKRCL